MWTSWETHYSRGKACSVNNSLREWVASSVQHMWPMLQVIGSWFANITKNLNRKLLLISFNDSRALVRVKRAQRSTMGKKIYPSQKIW